MSEAFECDRCDVLKRGTGNRHAEYGRDSDGNHERTDRDFCDRCDEIVTKVMDGELTIDDFRLHGSDKRP